MSSRSALLVLGILLLATPARTTFAQDAPERLVSLPWERAMRAAGFPDWDDPWTLEELERGARALRALAGRHPEVLPRAGSLVSGELFERFLDARSTPLEAQLVGVGTGLSAYLLVGQQGSLYDSELLLLSVRNLEIFAAFVSRPDVQADLRSGDPRARPVLEGGRQVIDGLLTSFEAWDGGVPFVVAGLRRLDPILPTLLDVLPVDERRAALDRLEALYRTRAPGDWRRTLGRLVETGGRKVDGPTSPDPDVRSSSPVTWTPTSDAYGRERIRELAFAEQSIDSLLGEGALGVGRLGAAYELYHVGDLDGARNCLSTTLSPGRELEWLLLSLVLTARGDHDGARSTLESVALGEGGETRYRLLAATALRSRGWKAPAGRGDELLGVVVEVSLERGLETLAAWTDGSVRYLNQGGAIVLHDAPEDPERDVLAPFVRGLLEAAAPLPASTPATVRPKAAPNAMRVTLLTLDGPRVLTRPPELDEQDPVAPALAAAHELLVATMDLVGD